MYNLRQYWEQEESEALPVTVSDWCTKHHPSDWKDVHRDVQVGYSRFSHRQSGLLGLACLPHSSQPGHYPAVSLWKLSRNLVIT